MENNPSLIVRLVDDVEGQGVEMDVEVQGVPEPLSISALARSGLVAVVEDSFERNGKVIEFKRVYLTPQGRDETDIGAVPVENDPGVPGRKPIRREKPTEPSPSPSARLVEALKKWRIAEARKQAIPPFCVLHDSVLLRIAAQKPVDVSGLLEIRGIGQTLARKYGDTILTIVARGI